MVFFVNFSVYFYFLNFNKKRQRLLRPPRLKRAMGLALGKHSYRQAFRKALADPKNSHIGVTHALQVREP